MALASTIIGDVNETFIEHTLKWILPSIPVFAVYIQRMHPTILKDVAFIIASIFSPITLVVLILQCILLMTNLNEIMESRAFLLVFNFVLIGVLALIAFVGLELEKRKSSFQVNVLIGLSSMAILINAFAFYCIVYRINTWGWSANKLSIVGTNIILFVHFCWIVYSLFRGKDKEDKQRLLKNTLSGYLLIYFIWIFFVVFVLPLILN
jgi:hypothetical protein